MNQIKPHHLLAYAVLLTISTYASADWKYQNDLDKMTGKAEKYAIATSSNSLSLAFPYAGANKGRIYVQKHPQNGTNVYLIIDKGQILCSAVTKCTVQIRFDDDQPITFKGGGAADHDSRVVFILDSKRFIARATKAKKILAQINLYQNGNQVLEFSTAEPLVWDAPKTKK